MSQIRADAVVVTPRLYTWLGFIFAAALVAAINILIAPVHQVFHRVLVFVLLMLSLAQIRHTGWRGLISFIVLSFIALDLTLTLWAWFSFRSAFSYGFAQSVLETSAAEAFTMLELYWRYALLFTGVLALLLLSVAFTPALPQRVRRWPVITLILLLAGYSVQAALHQLRRNNLQSPVQRVLTSTPLSNASVFLQALKDKQLIASVTRNAPRYQLAVSNTGIDNYVLVIGESERKANMSIYGYGRETTPALEAQRKNLLLFSQAISGAQSPLPPYRWHSLPIRRKATISATTATILSMWRIRPVSLRTGSAARAAAVHTTTSLPLLLLAHITASG